MANPYPATFIDQNAEGRLVGELNFTDPANRPGGASPARNVGQAEYDFTAAGPTVGEVAQTWVLSAGDAAMLDLTDPTTPLPVAAGIYAVNVQIVNSGGGNSTKVRLRTDDDYYSVDSTWEVTGTEALDAGQVVAPAWFWSVGSAARLLVTTNGTGLSGRILVQKIG